MEGPRTEGGVRRDIEDSRVEEEEEVTEAAIEEGTKREIVGPREEVTAAGIRNRCTARIEEVIDRRMEEEEIASDPRSVLRIDLRMDLPPLARSTDPPLPLLPTAVDLARSTSRRELRLRSDTEHRQKFTVRLMPIRGSLDRRREEEEGEEETREVEIEDEGVIRS